MKKEAPGAQVTINPSKPRRGFFEVRVGAAVVLSLPDMPRPFNKLRAEDIPACAARVTAALKKGPAAPAAAAVAAPAAAAAAAAAPASAVADTAAAAPPPAKKQRK